MSDRFTTRDRTAKALTFHFWLIFSYNGDMRLRRGEPDCSRDERAMKLDVKLPFALFNTPTLKALIDVAGAEPVIPPIDLAAAGEALKLAIGCDVDIRIIEPENKVAPDA